MIFQNIFEMSNNLSVETNNNTRNVISNYSIENDASYWKRFKR